MAQLEEFDTQITKQSFESPFPTASYALTGEVSYQAEDSAPYSLEEYDSPFKAVYRLSEWEEEEGGNPESDELTRFVSELYDEEFNEVLSELVTEVADTYRTQFESEYGDPVAQRLEAEHYFEEAFEPLVYYVNSWIDHLVEEERSGALDNLSLEEFERFIDNYEPSFEGGIFSRIKKRVKKAFKKAKKVFKTFKKKAVKAVKKGIKVAKKLAKKGLKFFKSKILGKLKKAAKKIFPALLKKVLKVGLKLLPAKYRPIAKVVAKIFTSREVDEESWRHEFDAVEDVASLQSEFDLKIAELFMTETEEEEEVICFEYEESVHGDALTYERSSDDIASLNRARSEFMSQIADLEEGEDLAPIIEKFANTVRTIIQVAIRLIGRDRVIKLLAKLLTPLIGRLVKKVPSKALAVAGLSHGKASSLLSQALLDVGLRIFGWEISPEEERMLGPAAIAATVEDVVRDVAQLPEYVLEDEDLLSGQILEAFERSAAANLPPILPQEAYEENPELTEAFHTTGCWVFYPYWGHKPFLCKKYSRVFEVEITPQMADRIKVHGGKSLKSALRRRKLRRLKRRKQLLKNKLARGIRAKVHLYEAIPGTILSQIATQEQEALGTRVVNQPEFYPLTPEIAGLLLQEPGLGRDVSTKYLQRPSLIAVGQRFYSLELLDEEPEQVSELDEDETLSNGVSDLRITLDFPADQIRVAVFLCESDAQAIASRLRQHRSLGTVMKFFHPILKEGIDAAFSDQSYGSMRLIHGRINPLTPPGLALKMLSGRVRERLATKLLEWLEVSIVQHLRDLPKTLITAAEDPQDGLTLNLFLSHPPGFQALGRALRAGAQMQNADFTQSQPGTTIKVISGYGHG